MTTTTAVTNAQKITVLKHLVNDRDPGFVATVTRLPQDQVDAIADEYGWPDLDKVRWAIDELNRADVVDFGARPTPVQVHRSPQAAATPQAARPAAAPPSQRPVTPTAPRVNDNERRPVSTSANELIVAASRSPKKRTQALGVRVAGLLGDLSRILREEEEQEEAAREAAELREKNAKRIAELEAELARLKGTKVPKAPAERRTNQITRGVYPCDTCDRVLDTPQGKAAHQRRAHEGFDPAAVHRGA